MQFSRLRALSKVLPVAQTLTRTSWSLWVPPGVNKLSVLEFGSELAAASPDLVTSLPLPAPPFSSLKVHCQRSLPPHRLKLPFTTRISGGAVVPWEESEELPRVVLQIVMPSLASSKPLLLPLFVVSDLTVS